MWLKNKSYLDLTLNLYVAFKDERILEHKAHENFRTQVHIPKIYKSSPHSKKIIKAIKIII